MIEKHICKLTADNPELVTIDSLERGLQYIIDSDRKGICITGERGLTGLTIPQAKMLAGEISDILKLYL